jgi:hypothetical protein
LALCPPAAPLVTPSRSFLLGERRREMEGGGSFFVEKDKRQNCERSREKRRRTAFVFNTKTTGAAALGQSQSQKGHRF